MNIQDIERLVALMHATDIGEIELQHGAETLHLRFSSPAHHGDLPRQGSTEVTNVTQEGAKDAPSTVVRAPAFGFFFRAHPLLGTTSVQTGDRIAEGQHLGYIDAESTLCAVLSPGNGTLGPQITPDGTLVGYGDALIEIA